MGGFNFGWVVESSVSVLLAVTIGYCVILNQRLKRLHADRDMLRQMVSDLVGATDMANAAIAGLKQTASEADLVLSARLEEAEKFGMELANHVNSGQAVLERIARITAAAGHAPVPAVAASEPNRLQLALDELDRHQQSKGRAA
ncbi:MAG TPA: DUF6468 domain-containing protein [Devosiaceae bacterium]